jgi:hypothetical protein
MGETSGILPLQVGGIHPQPHLVAILVVDLAARRRLRLFAHSGGFE